MKNRILALLLLAALLLGCLAGCGGSAAPESTGGVSYIEDNLQLVEDADTRVDSIQDAQQERLDDILSAYDGEEEPEEEADFDFDFPFGDGEEEADGQESLPEEESAEPESAQEAEAPAEDETDAGEESGAVSVTEDGTYTDPDHVAAYIHTYGHLPDNFITKNEARDLGWDSSRGNLQDVAPGMSIGGDRFGNYEGLLPDGKYRECDVNYTGGYRGAERLIYDSQGHVYYTNDHYKSFTQLY